MKRLTLILFSVLFVCVAGYFVYTTAADQNFFGFFGGEAQVEAPVETTPAAEPETAEPEAAAITGTWAVTSRTLVVDGAEHTDYFEPDSMMTAQYAFNANGTYIGADESGTWTQVDDATYTLKPDGNDMELSCVMPNEYTAEVTGADLKFTMNKVQ